MRRVTTPVALGAVLAAVLSGCGGGSESPTTTTSTTTTPAASSSAAPRAALAAACTRYEGSRTTARQVATSAASPI
ncbi:MAG: hypothetical protein ABI251_13630, partial [Mycobacteriaceae bacterium]